jgi:hypothetical protein
MTPKERKPNAAADRISEVPWGGAMSPESVNGIAGNVHSSSPEAAMEPERPSDSSDLEQRKQAWRARSCSRPLRAEEIQCQEDARWALLDPELLTRYLGEFVVPYQRKIVAHGTDAAAVLAEASRITGRSVEELPLIGMVDPLLDIPLD